MGSIKLKEFYTKRSSENEDKEKKFNHQLYLNSLYRIATFISVIFAIYFFWNNSLILVVSLLLGVITFLFLVKRHLRFQYLRNFYKSLKSINDQEINALDRAYLNFADGSHFSDPLHEYSQDIDLFGKGSFFQYINRTKLHKATQQLANSLKENSIDKIRSKQEVIKELTPKIDWRQNFLAEASLVEIEKDSGEIVDWITRYKSFVPQFMRFVAVVFTIISCAVLAIYAVGIIAESIVVLWLFIGLLVNAVFLKKINALSADSSSALSTFNQYGKLLQRIESETWESKNIKEKLNEVNSIEKNASSIIKDFSGYLNALDQRSNFMISIFLNGFFLRDILCTLKIEKWINLHADRVGEWFKLIHYFDQQISLANFAFNHPQFIFPEIINASQKLIEANKLGHPLLDEKKRISNDFSISKENFYIVTGANMAGKSTFLRTVSLAIVMSNVGLPVCATAMKYSPTRLVTSMRTNDSLSDEESYFFSELKRLRYIIDRIEEESYFIILDEILKGTNSKDKAEGSKKFLVRLVRSHSTGIIATHDLSLCVTADEMEAVSNYYFDAEIINDELHFDYLLKKGVCKNMNASFLLKKMDIV